VLLVGADRFAESVIKAGGSLAQTRK